MVSSDFSGFFLAKSHESKIAVFWPKFTISGVSYFFRLEYSFSKFHEFYLVSFRKFQGVWPIGPKSAASE